MEVFLAAVIVFAVAFLGMALSSIRGKQSQCLGCSCKAARRIMDKAKTTPGAPCREELTRLE